MKVAHSLRLAALQEAAFRQHQGAHDGGCNGVVFAPSGLMAATCGQDGCVRLWTPYDGALSSELRAGASASAAGVRAVAFCEERNLVLGASNDKSIKAWDVHTGRLKFTMTGATLSCCSCIDARRVALCAMRY
jgi:WD40 repeat protein